MGAGGHGCLGSPHPWDLHGLDDGAELGAAGRRLAAGLRGLAHMTGPPPLTAFLTFISRIINTNTVGSLTIPRASIKWV